MNSVGLVGLCKIELPGAVTVRLCDGAFFEDWDDPGEFYRSADALLGTIASIDALGEGVGNEIPALEMTLLPPEASEPADLRQSGWQTSRCRLWISEYNPETGLLIGDPDLVFDGQLDQTVLSVGLSRELRVSVVSLAERLFERNIGNSMNPSFHKSIWPGELGHDNATGLSLPVAWGAGSPATSGGNPYYGSGPIGGPGRARDQLVALD